MPARRPVTLLILLVLLGLGGWRVGAGAPLLALDRTVQQRSQAARTPLGDDVARTVRQWGGPVGYLPVVLGCLLLGWQRRSPRWRRRGWRIAGALILSGLLCWAIKVPTGRTRPRFSSDPALFQPFGGATSLPSGHSTTAFTLSTAIALEGAAWPVSTGLFLLAAGTGWSRINDNRHWLSDVVLGALLGIGSAWWVVRRWPDPEGQGRRPDSAAGPADGGE